MIKPSRMFLSFLGFLFCASAFASDQWIAPTADELSMKSIPEVTGAPALFLYKEQTADDGIKMWSYYVRLKVLTEGGKDYANVELPYFAGSAGWSIDSIAGRTVHPDGSMTQFTGKPYDKLVEQVGGYKLKVKVFTLPAVEVGSILEYRYKLRYDESYYAPDWFVQTDLFTRRAHYSWKATGYAEQVAWTPLLPPGTAVKVASPGRYELDVKDVMPVAKEDYTPPMDSVSYRVLFYYTTNSVTTVDAYWKTSGKDWAKERDKFIGPNKTVKEAVGGLVGPADTPTEKLRKIYDAIQAMDNTDFSREHTSREDKAAGFKDVNSTDDILKRRRGTSDQLTELFVAMARAAGMKAYLMGVANRNQRFFLPSYLSFSQIDDYIALVGVDGREVFFDPGSRYCKFGHLAWKHTMTGGLRQTENGSEIVYTPLEPSKEAHTSRIADLTLDEHGSASGSVILSYTGDPALTWRQEALRGDETSLHAALRTHMEELLPGGMEVRVTKVENLTDPDKPLQITYEVKGAIGAPTGKRLLVPANLFEANVKARFTSAKRELPLDMHYASYVQDAVRFRLPASLVVESAPGPDQAQVKNAVGFNTSSKTSATSITLFRNVTLAKVMYPATDYPDLRAFYNKLESKDQETLVLTRASVANASAGAGGN